MLTGTLTLNGIDDAQLIIVLQVKEQFPFLQFNPQGMQPAPRPGPPNQRAKCHYNNVAVSWGQDDGLTAIKELLTRLTPVK
jgi:hypothetical protein